MASPLSVRGGSLLGGGGTPKLHKDGGKRARAPECSAFLYLTVTLREDVNIHNCWLQPRWCSMEQLRLGFPIQVGSSWLLNMGAAASEF